MICDDDVLSNQAVQFHDGKRQVAGFYTDKLLVPAGQTRSLRWCVYPVASGEYYDFINLVRQDRGANYTIPGPWYAFGGTEAVLALPREGLAKHR